MIRKEKKPPRFASILQEGGGMREVLVDTETGVQYLMACGPSGTGTAVIVLVDRAGKPLLAPLPLQQDA